MITSRLELDAHALEVLDVLVDDRLRQAVLGDAVAEHAADRVQRLEDRHRVAELREIARRREARRARADDRDLLGPARDGLHGPVRRVRALPVRDEALEPADRDRLLLAQDHAVQLALVLDRADAAADRREEVPPPDRARGALEVAQRDAADELADRDVDGAARPRSAGPGTGGSAGPRRPPVPPCSRWRPLPSCGAARRGRAPASRSCAGRRSARPATSPLRPARRPGAPRPRTSSSGRRPRRSRPCARRRTGRRRRRTSCGRRS